jgi:uncharacterized surface protein with fasciclin (FAS1) repeats
MKAFIATVLVWSALGFAQPSTAEDLVDTARHSVTFNTFLAAAKSAGLLETLKDSGPYTLFIPTDEAFNKLPAGTVESLMKDKKKLAQIIEYHVVPGKIMVADVKPGQVKTMEGSPLKLTSDNGKVTLNDGANVIQSDLIADNGVIHEIDALVIPSDIR